MSAFEKLRRSEWLAIRAQIGLGIIFLMAAWPKLADPPQFAKNIWAYGMLPDFIINLKAIMLPGIELAVGLALVTGYWVRGAAWIAGLLLVMFTVAIAYNAFIVHNPIHCSCFELHPAVKTCSQLLTEMRWEVLRDLGMLALAAHVAWARRASSNCADVATPAA